MSDPSFAKNLRDAAEDIPDPDADPDAAPDAGPSTATPPEPSPWLRAHEVLADVTRSTTRLRTGFLRLDTTTGGGIPLGKVINTTGRPGSGKTTFDLQIAATMARQGAAVGALLADEGLAPAAFRLAQGAGFDRAKLEAADPQTIAAACEALKPLSLYLLNPDDPTATFLDFIAGLDKLAAPEAPRVWLLDSAQVIRLAQAERDDASPRERVKALVERIRREAVQHSAVALLVSQSNRAAYRSKKPAENSDPLAAGAESGALEYMSDVLLVLSGDVSTGVEVFVAKNRLGPSGFSFRLAFDRERALFREVNAAEAGSAADRAQRERLGKLKSRMLEVLAKEPDGLLTASLVDRLGVRRGDVVAARNELEREGRIFGQESEGRGGTRWRFATSGTTES